ncbi:exonuclease subunit SbcD [Oceanimonas sp. NS1]|nr:exonuclease subunit SbcD [Oceanimonas sp. NS1]
MRILHTSDWHLGQHFMGKTRLDEHAAFLDWLVQQVEQHRVDAVLVAGDIFDTGTPPSYARELYHNFVVTMSRTDASLVLLGGNHDSVAMLNESRALLQALHVSVIPGRLAEPEQQLITLHHSDGAPGALLCAIPFLRPRICWKAGPATARTTRAAHCSRPLPTIIRRCLSGLGPGAPNWESYPLSLPVISPRSGPAAATRCGTFTLAPWKPFPPVPFHPPTTLPSAIFTGRKGGGKRAHSLQRLAAGAGL